MLDRFLHELRTRLAVIPGTRVVLRMAADAMFAAGSRIIAEIDVLLDGCKRRGLDALLAEKTHVHKDRFS